MAIMPKLRVVFTHDAKRSARIGVKVMPFYNFKRMNLDQLIKLTDDASLSGSQHHALRMELDTREFAESFSIHENVVADSVCKRAEIKLTGKSQAKAAKFLRMAAWKARKEGCEALFVHAAPAKTVKAGAELARSRAELIMAAIGNQLPNASVEAADKKAAELAVYW